MAWTVERDEHGTPLRMAWSPDAALRTSEEIATYWAARDYKPCEVFAWTKPEGVE